LILALRRRLGLQKQMNPRSPEPSSWRLQAGYDYMTSIGKILAKSNVFFFLVSKILEIPNPN